VTSAEWAFVTWTAALPPKMAVIAQQSWERTKIGLELATMWHIPRCGAVFMFI
jgi:hypothetical protein